MSAWAKQHGYAKSNVANVLRGITTSRPLLYQVDCFIKCHSNTQKHHILFNSLIKRGVLEKFLCHSCLLYKVSTPRKPRNATPRKPRNAAPRKTRALDNTRTKQFRMALISAGLTTYAWAKQHGCTGAYISMILSGKRKSEILSKEIDLFIEQNLKNDTFVFEPKGLHSHA